MGVVAVLAAVMAVWVWTGRDVAVLRMTRLLATPRRWPAWEAWRAWAERGRPGKRAEAWRAASLELCHSLVAELAVGRAPGDALARALSGISVPDPDTLAPVVAAARDGGDVSAALLRAAPARGGEGFVRLAACWRVSVAVGGGLGVLVERVALSLREEQAHRQEVGAQLAGPRATAHLLASLPALGLLMAAGLGLSPVSFLVGSPAGFACLVIGVVLDVAGVWWIRRLVVHALASVAGGALEP